MDCVKSACRKKRARRRSAGPTGSCTDDTSLADGLHQAQGGIEWRDWANLEPGIVQDVAGRLLTADVAEYLRLRAACKPWRACTDDPRSGLDDSRFRPRDWIATRHCAPPSRCTLVNVATGARMHADFPELRTHHHLGSADGLLVLCDRATAAVRLLNPLTGALSTEYPAITDVQAMVELFEARSTWPMQLGPLRVEVPNPPPVKGAGVEDSTSPPTLVLCLREPLSRVVCAKPLVDW